MQNIQTVGEAFWISITLHSGQNEGNKRWLWAAGGHQCAWGQGPRLHQKHSCAQECDITQHRWHNQKVRGESGSKTHKVAGPFVETWHVEKPLEETLGRAVDQQDHQPVEQLQDSRPGADVKTQQGKMWVCKKFHKEGWTTGINMPGRLRNECVCVSYKSRLTILKTGVQSKSVALPFRIRDLLLRLIFPVCISSHSNYWHQSTFFFTIWFQYVPILILILINLYIYIYLPSLLFLLV